MSDTPEILGEESSAEAAVEIQSIQEARSLMGELADKIPELGEINAFVQLTHETGQRGIDALNKSIDMLADVEPGLVARG